jgi:hypothetical protein
VFLLGPAGPARPKTHASRGFQRIDCDSQPIDFGAERAVGLYLIGRNMTDSSFPTRPSIGDRILVVGLGPHTNWTGTVIEVVGSPLNAVRRYRVRFADGTCATLFGFELNLIDRSQSA